MGASLLFFSHISSLNPNNSPLGYVVFRDEKTESRTHAGQGRAAEARGSAERVLGPRARAPGLRSATARHPARLPSEAQTGGGCTEEPVSGSSLFTTSKFYDL